MSTVSEERVMVVPTELFHKLGVFQGFSSDVDKYVVALTDTTVTSYRPRSEVETDPSFKQMIPYVLFRYVDSQDRPWLFHCRRSKKQGEQRLHGKRSVGVGGHISTEDGQKEGSFDWGMRREIEEEVIIEGGYLRRCVGLINDDSNPVGTVHLGVVYVTDMHKPAVRSRGEEMLNAGFDLLSSLLLELPDFESWSQIVLTAMQQGQIPVKFQDRA